MLSSIQPTIYYFSLPAYYPIVNTSNVTSAMQHYSTVLGFYSLHPTLQTCSFQKQYQILDSTILYAIYYH